MKVRKHVSARLSGRAVMLAIAVATAVSLSSGGCLTESDSAAVEFACPPAEQFAIVSQVFERRCGTLDCHGDPARPFRVYGRTGLRAGFPDAGPPSGSVVVTTPIELAQNRLSACAVEPEEMDAAVRGELAAEELMLLQKSRLVQAHKGGRVMAEDSAGDRCISSWIAGSVDVAACEGELLQP